MHIVKIVWRNKNDFRFIACCKHCEKKSHHGDGYADEYYQTVVFPHRHCEHCELDEYGNKYEEDKGTNARSN